MKRNKFGIHISNKNHRNFGDLLQMGVHNYTVLHHNVEQARQVRATYPDALILCRFYQPRWSDLDPISWAKTTAQWYHETWRDITRHVTPANEMNLPFEGGGWSRDDYKRINEWLVAYAEEFRRLCPDAILHFPAFAAGHYEDGRHEDGYDLDWSGYAECAEAIALYDVMDIHCYWRVGGRGLWDDLGRWYAWRFVHDRPRFYPGKPVFISECGNFDTRAVSTPAELLYFFLKLYEYKCVLGATPFIWDSGPEHDQNIWVNNMQIAQVMKLVYKPEVEIAEPEPLQIAPEPKLYGWLTLWPQLPTRDGGYSKRDLGDIDTIILHHWGSDVDWGDQSDYFARKNIRAVAEWQVFRRDPPLNGYAYHYTILLNGKVAWCNPASYVTWHAGDWEWNRRSVAVVFPGDHRRTPLTEAQVAAAKWLINRLRQILPRGEAIQVKLHWEVRPKPTECPGQEVARWKEYLAALA